MVGRRRSSNHLCIGFLVGNAFMLALHSITLLHPFVAVTRTPEQQSTVPVLPTDCLGLEGTKVLLLDVHLEGNLGDEMETTPLLKELKRCGIHITAVLSGWLEGRDQQLGFHSVREHGMVDSLQSPGNYERFIRSEYHAVILAPGPWRLCQFKWWPYHQLDILMGGSILKEEDCDVSKRLESWNPSLIVVRETYSYNLLQNLSEWTRVSYMSGDLSHSFVPAEPSLEYWKRTYSTYRNKILIFARASNAPNVITIKGRTVELTTLHAGTVTLPAGSFVFATSSALEDATWFVDWKHQYSDRLKEHQFVICQTVEQLFALIHQAKQVYTDRYHPGVVAHRMGKEFTILQYEQEQSKLIGLNELVSTKVSAKTIQDEYNTRAFSKLRETLRKLRKQQKVV
jgi:hypothetical protein